MELSKTAEFSQEDLFRISLLEDLMENYLNGKEKYQEIPEKMNSLLQMISTLKPEYVEKLKKCWGQIKLIQAESTFDKKPFLTGLDKRDFDTIIKEIRNLSCQILLSYPMEPGDQYAWPFKEK